MCYVCDLLQGEKVFYMVRPTDVNLELYQQWVSSASQGEIFFGDQVHSIAAN